MVECDRVDTIDGGNSKLVKNLSKICQEVKKLSKNPKASRELKNLQKPLVRKNIYQSTDPLLAYRCIKLEFTSKF